MDYADGIATLRSWVGRSVIAVWLTPDDPSSDAPRPAGPLQGRLELRDMWPDLDPAENPQRLGEVEFFDVLRPERRPDLINPEGATFALYNSVFMSVVELRDGRGLAFLTHGRHRLDFWIDD